MKLYLALQRIERNEADLSPSVEALVEAEIVTDVRNDIRVSMILYALQRIERSEADLSPSAEALDEE